MHLKQWYFFSLLCFYCFSAFSQQDTTKAAPKPEVPTHITYVSETDLENLNGHQQAFDSSLTSFHRTRDFLYDITRERNIFIDKSSWRKRVVNFSNDLTLPYKFSDRTIKYYKLNKRFTEITYLVGAKKEQLLNVAYAQNLMKGWSAGLDFRRAGSEGFFRRQVFYQSSFDLFTHYQSPNERYNLYAYYLRNRLEQQENGGVNNFDPTENTVAQPTYLTEAENDQTDKEFLLRQSYELHRHVTDSVKTERNIFSISHTLRYEARGNSYFETPVDSFYKFNYFDSLSTYDSTWYQRWNNELVLGYSNDTSGTLSASLSAGHEYFIYKYGNPAKAFIFGEKENFYSCAALHWNQKRNHLEGKMCMYYKDYSGDYDATLLYSRILLNDKWKIFVHADRSISHPDVTDQRRYSNHFIWFNSFAPFTSQKAEAGFGTTNGKLLLSASYFQFEDLIYYDSTSTPKQLTGTISYYRLKLQKTLTWRNWIFENIVEYQKADNENVIHLPDWMTGHSLCYEKYFFHNALFGRVGMDARYVSSYYADRYMPALQEFYLQYSQKTGGYVFADFFITFRIKAARFFIKMENLFNGVAPSPQFYRPDYPLTPRCLRFGLQLRFFD